MNYILDIIKKLVFFMIISNILINLVSNDSYKKYIKIYLGIFFIMIVITSFDNICNAVSFDTMQIQNDNSISKKYEEIIYNNLNRQIKDMNSKIVSINISDNYEINDVHIVTYENNVKEIKNCLITNYNISEKNIRIEYVYGDN